MDLLFLLLLFTRCFPSFFIVNLLFLCRVVKLDRGEVTKVLQLLPGPVSFHITASLDNEVPILALMAFILVLVASAVV